MAVIFRGIFWLGIIISLLSLFVHIDAFLAVLILGTLCILYSLYEQHRIKSIQTISTPQTKPTLQPQKTVAKTLRLPAKTTQKPLKKTHASFFTKVLQFFKRKKQPKQEMIKHDFIKHTPQFEKMKKLFQETVTPNKPLTKETKQPYNLKQIVAKKFTKTPNQKQTQFFPWEKEEHYIPTGADHLQPIDLERDEIAQQKDERYTTVPIGTIQKTKATPTTERLLATPKIGLLKKLLSSKITSTKQPLITPNLGSIKEITLPKGEPTLQPKAKVAPLPKEGIQQIVHQKTTTKEKDLEQLKKYIRESQKQNYPIEHIKAAVTKAGWPKEMITQAFKAETITTKKKKFIILGVMFLVLILLLIVLNTMDLLLLDYLFETIQHASMGFYIGASVVFLLIIGIIIFKTKNILQEKKTHHKEEETKHVQEIKTELEASKEGFETDFDRLYKLIEEKKKLTLREIAAGFGIKRSKAEEWGKILKEQGLIELNYPAVGEPELQWKKLMSTK
tara:strand:- start:51539 stop:53050 length:1512 start_codon:yes stop_codon:yes gene_type:complete